MPSPTGWRPFVEAAAPDHVHPGATDREFGVGVERERDRAPVDVGELVVEVDAEVGVVGAEDEADAVHPEPLGCGDRPFEGCPGCRVGALGASQVRLVGDLRRFAVALLVAPQQPLRALAELGRDQVDVHARWRSSQRAQRVASRATSSIRKSTKNLKACSSRTSRASRITSWIACCSCCSSVSPLDFTAASHGRRDELTHRRRPPEGHASPSPWIGARAAAPRCATASMYRGRQVVVVPVVVLGGSVSPCVGRSHR